MTKHTLPTMEALSSVPSRKQKTENTDALCILAGTTHQGGPGFSGENSQCVAMSACASVLSIFKNRKLESKDIDVILQCGDALYMSLNYKLPPGEKFLYPEDLPSEICVGNYFAKIEDMSDNWIQNGLFPKNFNDYTECLLNLENLLVRDVFKDSDYPNDADDGRITYKVHNDITDSIIFTGQNYTVSFWRFEGIYYLFNSHAVDENNKHHVSGVARLFKCNTLGELAKLLFARNVYNGQYTLHRLRVTNYISEHNLVPIPLITPHPTFNGSQLIASTISSCITSNDSHSSQSQSILHGLQLILSTNDTVRQITQSHTNVTVSQTSQSHTNVTVSQTIQSHTNVTVSQTSQSHKNDTDSQTTQSQSILTGFQLLPSSPVDMHNPVVTLQNIIVGSAADSVEVTATSTKRGRPKKVKRGNQRTKVNAHLDAVIKYNIKNSHVNREAVKKYTRTNPEIHREAVKKYSSTNPEINRKAVKKYSSTNPEIHREAVQKYSSTNPEINRKAVKRYSSTNPEIHREAAHKYSSTNPEINRKAVKRYSSTNPEIHREAAQKYSSTNPEINREAVKKYTSTNPQIHRDSVYRYNKQHPEINRIASDKYNKISRNNNVRLRQSTNLIGQKKDPELEIIQLFSLKNNSLLNPNTFRCSYCSARLFEEEKSRKQWCCGSGAYNIQTFTPLTEDFYTSTSFVDRPRAYNNLFAFSALGVSHGYQQPTGFSFLKIQGRVYHRVFDLAYTGSVNNLGLYINDSNEREQLAKNLNLDVQVIRSIKHFLYNVNPFIECFKSLSQEPSDEAFIQFQQTSRATHGNILGEVPVGREVAAIISTERETYVPRCIAVWKVGNKKPHTVDIMHPLYESFQYPLLYPEGNAGWYPNKVDNNGKKLTQVKYIRCLLLSEQRFSEFGRLSEEWLVDMYCRICEERLRFLSNLQKCNSNNALRSAPLQEVEMSIEVTNQIRQDETIQGEGFVAGRVYLPSSFTGGPRYMKGKYSDAIAIVSRLGKPSYFLTFTCNPKWSEIQQSTQSRSVNPLVCARVFNLKLTELLRDIRSGRWFGKCIYMMHVIEFQKRGLPHAHICFRVEGGGPVQNLDIDKFVRADIPDPLEAEGRLQRAVLNHMIHGPCGPSHRTNLPCWDNEKMKCTKFFPKRETATTFSDDKGYINYCRNSKNVANINYRGQDVEVNDTWVVPYNASLLLKYDAHINLEVCSQRAVIKYLFKYITKGPDESRVAIVPEEHENNEIEQYATKRYVGSSDAAWRTLEFDVTAREPNVKQLPVHLENQQAVYFKPGTEAEAVQRADSDLITYFSRPIGDEFDTLTYLDFYEKYIVHAHRPSTKNTEIYKLTNNKFITKRQRGELVARLFWVAPNRGEQFYLRMLLKSYPCRSYTDLKHLGGPNCTTFQEAAKIVGLADDEIEYERAMLEASTFFTGPRLRSFFVLLAVNGVPVASLWETFKNQLSEDISHRLGTKDNDKVYTLCLIQINRMLRKHGSSLTQLGLPEVSDNTTELGRERIEYDLDTMVKFVDEWVPRLSLDQRLIYDYVTKLCIDENYRNMNNTAIFIDGPAGTGKTKLLNIIAAHVRGSLKGVVLCTASSAIAAQNYEGGTTAHSMFRFPLELVDDLGYWNITNGTQRAELIFNANVIIYDEAPMAHKFLIHLLDRSLRDLMRNDNIFGGKIIIFAGDFRQIPPVVTNAKSNSDILNASVKTSPIWCSIKSFSLTTSQRCKEDVEFAEFLLNLGSNKLVTHTEKIYNTIQHFVELSGIDIVSELEELIDFVFPSLSNNPGACIFNAILSSRNDAVREINNIILEKLDGEILHFYSIDTVEKDNADELFLGPDALNQMQPRGMPEHDLTLKIGCVCMVMRNLSFADGLVNGTKVIVTATSPRLITVKKSGSSDVYLIPRIIFKGPIEPKSPFEICRRQFPLQLCYAMTIHKSQGQTINRVGVDLRSDMFSHGQLYVALGRVTTRQHIRILIHKDRMIDGKPYAKNVIIPELL